MKIFRNIIAGVIMLITASFAVAQTVYKIESVNNGTVLDLDGYHAVQYGYYGGPWQRWVLEDVGGGEYVIRNSGNGNVLDLDGYYAVQYGYYGGPWQHWTLEDVGGGVYVIRNAGNGDVLDLDGYYAVHYPFYGGPNQYWRLVSMVPAPANSVALYRSEKYMVTYQGYMSRFGSDYMYSTDPDEGPRLGYSSKGVSCMVFATQEPGTVPLYRYYSSSRGVHFYTTNYSEHGSGDAIFAYEGVQCYVYGQQQPGTAPLYRYNRTGSNCWGEFLYTLYPGGEQLGAISLQTMVPNPAWPQTPGAPATIPMVLTNSAFSLEGVQCYVYPP